MNTRSLQQGALAFSQDTRKKITDALAMPFRAAYPDRVYSSSLSVFYKRHSVQQLPFSQVSLIDMSSEDVRVVARLEIALGYDGCSSTSDIVLPGETVEQIIALVRNEFPRKTLTFEDLASRCR